MKAERNSYSNDSAYLQFSGALSAGGSALAKIGTTSGLNITLEEGSGAGESGWGWNDDSYGGLGTNFYFSSDGAQTLRVQRREDGICIDQIIISSSRYLTARPGLTKNDTTIISR